MEPPSPIHALGVNPFPSRFIIRTVSIGGGTLGANLAQLLLSM